MDSLANGPQADAFLLGACQDTIDRGVADTEVFKSLDVLEQLHSTFSAELDFSEVRVRE